MSRLHLPRGCAIAAAAAAALTLPACGGSGPSHTQTAAVNPCQAVQARVAPDRPMWRLVAPATTAAAAASELRAAGLSPQPWSRLSPSDPVYRCNFTSAMSRTDLHPVQLFVDAAANSSLAPTQSLGSSR